MVETGESMNKKEIENEFAGYLSDWVFNYNLTFKDKLSAQVEL